MMKISQNGINLIKTFEGVRLKAYKCVPTEKYCTIGYGHYGVEAGLVITMEEAEQILISDLAKFEAKVNKYHETYQFNQNQFDALVSFAYNVGNIDTLTAKGTRSFEEISDKMLEYNKSGGKVLAGLTRRRKTEQALFNRVTSAEIQAASIPQSVSSKSLDTLANEVIQGKWGNGNSRKKLITAAGYNYKEVQALVNTKLKQK